MSREDIRILQDLHLEMKARPTVSPRATLLAVVLIAGLEIFVLGNLPILGVVLPVTLLFVSFTLTRLDSISLAAGLLLTSFVRDLWFATSSATILLTWLPVILMFWLLGQSSWPGRLGNLAPIATFAAAVGLMEISSRLTMSIVPFELWLGHLVFLLGVGIISLVILKRLERLLGRII